VHSNESTKMADGTAMPDI